MFVIYPQSIFPVCFVSISGSVWNPLSEIDIIQIQRSIRVFYAGNFYIRVYDLFDWDFIFRLIQPAHSTMKCWRKWKCYFMLFEKIYLFLHIVNWRNEPMYLLLYKNNCVNNYENNCVNNYINNCVNNYVNNFVNNYVNNCVNNWSMNCEIQHMVQWKNQFFFFYPKYKILYLIYFNYYEIGSSLWHLRSYIKQWQHQPILSNNNDDFFSFENWDSTYSYTRISREFSLLSY